VRLSCLGHATWLAEAGDLRLLVDPLLEDRHHGGVFDVFPRRAVHAEALRPDFLLVSHAHPDHFDPESLARLARLDPDTVVVTPDALVASSATRLGFRTVRVVPPGTRVELDTVTLVTTPSVAPDEWGVVLGAGESTVFDQVDTVFESPGAAARVVARALEALGHAPGARLDLGLLRWQPMLEVAAVLGERTAFPHRDYAAILSEIAAIDARFVVPSASGAVHVDHAAWLNGFVHPVSEARFLRDLERRAPRCVGLSSVTGDAYEVAPGSVAHVAGGGSSLVTVTVDERDPRRFRPIAIPPVTDARGTDIDRARAVVEPFVLGALAPALGRAFGQRRMPLRFVLEVVCAGDDRLPFTITVANERAVVERRSDDEWDALVEITGSALADVLEARRHFGDALLGGELRGRVRAYDVSAEGLSRTPVGAIFLYHALSYEDAFRRWVEAELDRLAPP
jgi:hypothetical protein